MQKTQAISAGNVVVKVSSGKASIGALTDGTVDTLWHSDGNEHQRLDFDLGGLKELGGLVIDWGTDNHQNRDVAKRFDVLVRSDGKWVKVYAFNNFPDHRTSIYLPAVQTDRVRLVLRESNGQRGYGIRGVEFKAAATKNDFFAGLAKRAGHGAIYPAYLAGLHTSHLVVGGTPAAYTALLSLSGAVEVDRPGFTLEPFIRIREQFLSADNAVLSHTTDCEFPSAVRKHDKLTLTTTAFTVGDGDDAIVYVRYRVKNTSEERISGKLFAAVRPFRVVPSFAGEGGFTPVRSIKRLNDNRVVVNKNKVIVPFTAPAPFAATCLDGGDIALHLLRNVFPASTQVVDGNGFASGAYGFLIGLNPGEEQDYYLAVRNRRSRKRLHAPVVALNKSLVASRLA